MKRFVQLRQLKETIPFKSKSSYNAYLTVTCSLTLVVQLRGTCTFLFLRKSKLIWIFCLLSIMEFELLLTWGRWGCYTGRDFFTRIMKQKLKLKRTKTELFEWRDPSLHINQKTTLSIILTKPLALYTRLNWLTCFIVCDMKENDTRSMVNMTQSCALHWTN